MDARQPKTVQVYELLRSAIIAMQMPPGIPIVEKEIVTQLGISRTPLREAVLQLATESLVVIRPAEGTFVNRIVVREVLQGQITRDTLEMRLTRLAARHYEASWAKRFELALFQQHSAAERQEVDEFFALDNQFHRLICECSGFPDCWRTIHGATGQLDRVRRHAFPTENNFQEVLWEHRAMFAAIRERDEEAVAGVFQRQLDSTFPTLALIRMSAPDLLDHEGELTISSIR